MASITRRQTKSMGPHFTVQIRRRGRAPLVRTFAMKANAKRWAEQQERIIECEDAGIGASHVPPAFAVDTSEVQVQQFFPVDARKGYVYVIGDGGPVVKIGMSNNPNRRLRGLQASSPTKLRILWAASCPAAWMRRLENRCHSKFRSLREHNEWFRVEWTDVRDFVEAMQ